MRKQYYLRPRNGLFTAWDVDRLLLLTKDFPRISVSLDAIREMDEPHWFSGGDHEATCRAVMEHGRLMNAADLSFPIILSSDGRVMDGMHRVAKAVMNGLETVEAVRFQHDPQPDFIDIAYRRSPARLRRAIRLTEAHDVLIHCCPYGLLPSSFTPHPLRAFGVLCVG